MKIAVNTHLLLYGKLDGIGWFTHETLERLTRSHPDHQFILIFDQKPRAEMSFPSNTRIVILPPPARHPLLWLMRFEVMMPLLLCRLKPDVFLTPDGWMPLNTSVPVVQVLHDINFAHKPANLPFWPRWYYNTFFPRFAKKAKRIVTVSHYSRKDIIETYGVSPEKVDVAYNGCNTVFKPVDPQQQEQTRQHHTQGNPYFVFVGALIPRKNIERMLLAFEKFRQSDTRNMKLLIVGPRKWGDKQMKSVYENMQYREDVIFTGRKNAMELNDIYAASQALLFVPCFEGFGIPILEAFNAETAVITSNVTSMPEVAGDAAITTNPFSSDAICSAMQRIAGDPDLRNELIRKGRKRREQFSWDYTAENLWKSIMKAMDQKSV